MGANEQIMAGLRTDLQGFAVAGQKQIMRWLHAGTVRQFGRSPGTPIDTGEARSGGRVGLNAYPDYQPPAEAAHYPVAGDDHVDSALSGMQFGDVPHWRNRVPYASVLEGGRRFSSELGRMIGSEQAPEGFLRKSVEEAGERLRSWEYRP